MSANETANKHFERPDECQQMLVPQCDPCTGGGGDTDGEKYFRVGGASTMDSRNWVELVLSASGSERSESGTYFAMLVYYSPIFGAHTYLRTTTTSPDS